MFKKLFPLLKKSKSNINENSSQLKDAIDLIDFVIKKTQNDALSSNYVKQVEQFKKSSNDNRNLTELHIYLLGEQILIKQKLLDPKEKLNFRKEVFGKFEGLVKREPFIIATNKVKQQENSLAKLFLNQVLVKVSETQNGVFENSQFKDQIDNEQDLSILSKSIFSKLENDLGKEVVINIYQDIYYKLSDQYR